MTEHNIRLDIQYNGTGFCGWQFQPGEITIQGKIEEAIEKVTGKKASLIGAGRTDAGVHALGQVANFRIDHHLPPEKYRAALNFHLPRTIVIMSSIGAEDDFHARKSARWRHYRYIVDRRRTALFGDFRWEYQHPLQVEPMQAIADIIMGHHDFSSFCTIASQKENNDCDVTVSRWREDDSMLIYDIRANRFLHSMVRSLVGVMVEAGRKTESMNPEVFRDLMESGDHTRIKHVAPARGLYLVEVGY